MDNDFLAAKTDPDSLWDYELNDYANPEYRAAKTPSPSPYPKAEEPQ